jgi:hypothetical protein
MLYIWRHIRLQIPDDWEMLFYGREMQAGRCAFADRYQHRMELSWSTVPGKPDFDRMISDYLAEVRRDERASEAAEADVAGWRGFSARLGDVLTTRFGTYQPEEKLLLECVFLWPDRRERDVERRVLASIAHEPARDGLRRWRAFGMDFDVTDGLSLQAAQVRPGDVRLSFRADKVDGREETFERIALVEHWLRRPVREWLSLRRPSFVRMKAQELETNGTREIEHLVGDRPGPGIVRLWAGRTPFDSRAWREPQDGRMYVQSISGARAVNRRLFSLEERP